MNYLAPLLSLVLIAGCRTTAPEDLTLTEAYSVADLGGGDVVVDFGALPRPVLLVFWQSWCGQCRDESPAVSHLVRTGGGGWDTIGVSVDKEADRARAFVEELRPAYDSLHDPDLLFCDALAVGSVPALVLVDRSGRVAHRSEGVDAGLRRALKRVAGR